MSDCVEVLRRLAEKLDDIEANSGYQAVWIAAYNHGVEYTGPNYTKELEEAHVLLAQEVKVIYEDTSIYTQPCCGAPSDKPHLENCVWDSQEDE